MLSNEHLKLLLQAVAVVLALHYAKGYMTGQYRNLMAVGLVAVVLVVVNHLFAEYEGLTACQYECLDNAREKRRNCIKNKGIPLEKIEKCEMDAIKNAIIHHKDPEKERAKCIGGEKVKKELDKCNKIFTHAWATTCGNKY